MNINLNKDSIECQFIFFYDLKIKIIDNLIKYPESRYFERREISSSELNQYSFADDLVNEITPLHIHGKGNQIFTKSNIAPEEGITFEFSSSPCGVNTKTDSYSPIECTLFRNGNLTVTIRLTNNSNEPIPSNRYVELIARPEVVRSSKDTAKFPSGPLIYSVWDMMPELEKQLAEYLNLLEIQALTLDNCEQKTLLTYFENDINIPISLKSGQTLTKGKFIHHVLKRSRPYIGTIVDLSDEYGSDYRSNKSASEEVQEAIRIFSIACARTTPQFLNGFSDSKRYLEVDRPTRNIYHPGPSIVFIGRRGWSCVILDKARDKLSFHYGVEETVLFAIQAILSSVRSTRRFTRDVISRVNMYIIKNNLSDSNNANISKLANLLERARINAPYNDMVTLLNAHITTHTGLAAIRRIKYLTNLDEINRKADEIIRSYDFLLESVNPKFLVKSLTIATKRLNIATIALFISLFTLVLTIVIKIYEWFN